LPASRLEAGLAAEFEEVQKNGVTQEEVTQAVKQLSVEMLDSIRTPSGLAQFVGTVFMVLGDVAHVTRDLEKYRNVTRDDVKRVAKEYFHPNNRTVVVLKPESAKPTAPAA